MVAFGPQGVVTGPAAPGSLLELQTPPPPPSGCSCSQGACHSRASLRALPGRQCFLSLETLINQVR